MANKVPVVEDLDSETVAPKKESKGEVCWNCKNQDPDTTNRLNSKGVCKVCGFEKDKLYNGDIEADKRAQAIEAAKAAERG